MDDWLSMRWVVLPCLYPLECALLFILRHQRPGARIEEVQQQELYHSRSAPPLTRSELRASMHRLCAVDTPCMQGPSFSWYYRVWLQKKARMPLASAEG